MITHGSRLLGGVAAVVLAMPLSAPEQIRETRFTLASAVPNDVFVFAAQRHNPEREFLSQYWGEVFDALRQCGIDQDVVELIGSLLGADPKGEIERLKERASQLLAGVDWGQLAGKEMAFVERLAPPVQPLGQRPPVLLADMVWLFRGSGDGAARNFEGLVAILEALVEEINQATGTEALVIKRTSASGAQLASVNVLAMVPTEPLPISIALREDVVIIAVRDRLLGDVLSLLDGSSSKKALADDPRFQAAFAKLPSAEDAVEFFDMQAFSRGLGETIDVIVSAIGGPRDVYRNTGNAEANRLNRQAVRAYEQGDIKGALALVEQAHDVAPEHSIVLYNLACFHALLGNKDEALDWLEKAVEGGFYGPGKIASDPDLESLRNEPRYKAALARATKLAEECCVAEDVVINTSPKRSEAAKLCEQAWEAYKRQDYEQGLKLVEQAERLAPADSRVLYYLACFHALLGHKDKALDFLERAVEGGFCCPQHISNDPDLESIRSDRRYEAALRMAKEKAAKLTAKRTNGKLALVKRLIDRGMNALSVLDYTAAVESTEGYAVWRESISVLVPDARERPIYPVFAGKGQLTDFDRYLPEETVSFSVSGGFDPGALYKFIEDTFRAAGPTGEELLAKWDEIQEEIGVDVRADILDWIDGDYVTVTLADDAGSVWLIKVTDEQVAREKVAAAIEFLSTKLTEAMGKNPGLAPLVMLTVQTSPAQHEDLEGFQNLHLAVAPQQPIVWGVADGHLIVGTSADAVALCLETARGTHPNVRENARVMSEALVPTEPFTSVSLTDRRNLGEELAKGVGIASMMMGTLSMAIPEPKARLVISKLAGMAAKLTPVLRKVDFYKSTASQTTFDGSTWHTRSVTHYFSPAERASKP